MKQQSGLMRHVWAAVSHDKVLRSGATYRQASVVAQTYWQTHHEPATVTTALAASRMLYAITSQGKNNARKNKQDERHGKAFKAGGRA